MRVQAFGLGICPESPVWLEWRGQTQAASKARRRLQGTETGAANSQAEADSAASLESGKDATQPLRQGSDSLRYTEDQVGFPADGCELPGYTSLSGYHFCVFQPKLPGLATQPTTPTGWTGMMCLGMLSGASYHVPAWALSLMQARMDAAGSCC